MGTNSALRRRKLLNQQSQKISASCKAIGRSTKLCLARFSQISVVWRSNLVWCVHGYEKTFSLHTCTHEHCSYKMKLKHLFLPTRCSSMGWKDRMGPALLFPGDMFVFIQTGNTVI